jgi:hypothetical protein
MRSSFSPMRQAGERTAWLLAVVVVFMGLSARAQESWEVEGAVLLDNVALDPASALPPSWMGWWASSDHMSDRLLLTPSAIAKAGSGRVSGAFYRVVGRRGDEYWIQLSRPHQPVRILKLVDGRLRTTLQLHAEDMALLNRMVDDDPVNHAGLIDGGGFRETWQRIQAPRPDAAWVEHAMWQLRDVPKDSLEKSLQLALDLARWPFHKSQLKDVYAVPRGDAVELVAVYRLEGTLRLWTTVLGPEGVRSSGDFLTINDPVAPPPAARLNDVSVPTAQRVWAEHFATQHPGATLMMEGREP